MKFNVGDIIRSNDSMTISDLNDNNENVDKGQYFVVVSYGQIMDEEGHKQSGHTILCQKSGRYSFWDEDDASLDEYFNKG